MTRALPLLLLALSAPASAQEQRKESRLFRSLGWATYATKGGDFLSTELALANGAYEGNALMRDRGVRAATSIAMPFVANYATAAVYQKHPRVALVTRIAVVALYGFAVQNNLRVSMR